MGRVCCNWRGASGGLPWGFMETDRPLPPATCQKVNGPECGNECQNRKYLMNGEHFIASWPAEAQQTARNDHEHKKQSGDDNGSQFDACELCTSMQSANGHRRGNQCRKREEFMESGYRTRDRHPREPRVV